MSRLDNPHSSTDLRWESLRDQALDWLQRQEPRPDPIPAASTVELITELQVHQAELELQNQQLRETQTALERAHNRYFTLFDLSPTSYLIFNRQHQTLELNLAAAELLDVDRNRARQRPFGHFLADASQVAFHEHITEVFSQGRKMKVELHLKHPDRPGRHIYLESRLLKGELGTEPLCLSAGIDITERKRAEADRLNLERRIQETQKLESLGVLAGGIAHDFNNILASILGNTSLALDDLPPASPPQRYLQQVKLSAERAAELCRQMLAYAGRGVTQMAALNLAAIVRETTGLLRVSINKKTDLKLDLPITLPPVQGDPSQIRQVVMNLVINASEAMGDHPGRVEVAAGLEKAGPSTFADAYLAPELPAGEYAYLEVADNGCGMKPDTLARIFEPFFTTKFIGRGLGLAAVVGIVRRHHGALKVRSEPGRGSTFRVYFPVARTLPHPTRSITTPTTPISQSRGTVLVVDDEPSVGAVVCRMLESCGFHTLRSTDGKDALARLQQLEANCALVVLDQSMPKQDGTETLGQIIHRHPSQRVLLMSGFNEPDALRQFGPGVDFIQKPFTPEQLQEKVRAMLEH